MGSGSRYDRLIKPDRVHGSLYTDPSDLRGRAGEDLVPHAGSSSGTRARSPQPNDYVRKSIGPQDVIMTRDKRRRGPPAAQPLRAPRQPGLRRREGQLQRRSAAPTTAGRTATPASCSATRSTRATAATNKLELGAGPGARGSTSYHGFVFGSFAEDGPTLDRAPRRRRRGDRPAGRGCRPRARSS